MSAAATTPDSPAAGPVGAPSAGPDRPGGAGGGVDADGWVDDRPALWRRYPAATALALYALLRLSGLVILAIFAHRAGADFWSLLNNRFDALRYVQVAEHGYDRGLTADHPEQLKSNLSNLPFFPLYPGLIALVAAVTPFSAPVSALIVSWAAGLAAAWGIYAVGAHVASRRVGLILVALWALLPHAVVQNMAYTETIFTALVAWTLYALLRRQWLTAGLLCLVAGLSRPTATTVAAAVGLTALVAIVRRQDGWRPWAAAALSPLGYLGYLAWVGHRLGRVDGYFYLQEKIWRIGFDGGASTFTTFKQVLTKPENLVAYTSTLLMGLAVVLIVLLVSHRYPLPLVVYSIAFFLITVGTENYYWAKGRYLVPAFALLLPIAVGLAKARRSTLLAVFGFLLLVSGWYGTYLCLVWHASP
ncbi:glycosyltransferase family 39 protein [Micromonospora sp. AP08]|uniref:glycosyltransferase family 39 protein n=1 Tax=Micromonospora sp. AP08 TaxID=2604467 RepID=UPI0011D69E88|nr:glycosyltransferase family 39 protein [Micromonospora sp. AP08]TYB38717.1 glycosyltransferase family 39 protein [Micromonospora sp. AP08]